MKSAIPQNGGKAKTARQRVRAPMAIRPSSIIAHGACSGTPLAARALRGPTQRAGPHGRDQARSRGQSQ
eukprot:scaffold5296_cov105-Isochrysis_galbana.AAC.10